LIQHNERKGENMEGTQEVQQVRHYKDGETRDRNGRWAGKVVTVRKEYYALIEEWQKQTGMKKSQFWREALMRGVIEVAKSHNIEASFPALEEVPSAYVKRKKRFPSWLFRKSVPSNGLRYPRWGGRRDAVRLEKG
jgi:hypothetical protein